MSAQILPQIHEVPWFLVVEKGEEKIGRMESKMEADIHLLYIFFKDLSGAQLNVLGEAEFIPHIFKL